MNPFSIFMPQPQQPAPAPTGAPAQPPTTTIPPDANFDGQSGPNTAPNGAVPPDGSAGQPGQQPSSDNADQSPLAAYAKLWETTSTGEGDEGSSANPLAIDPAELNESVAKINFANSVTPDTLQRVVAGGEEAAEALLEVVNAVARNVMAQSTLVSNKLAQRATDHQSQNMETVVQNLIKQHALTNNLVDSNPMFDHPAVKPVIDSVKQQLAVKYPNASTAELTSKAQEFAMAMATAFNPQAAAASNPAPDNSAEFPDFDKFITGQ